ncbi:type II secretion system minor pseudopilin GspK [Paenalcaligenes sp. Me131]|uniref:type II secretion system minor pseudopilin GspK n=1 Tax=Paenalcaligenes sp. Me131 TaxID=3392636 RepID=UPI003D28B4E7
MNRFTLQQGLAVINALVIVFATSAIAAALISKQTEYSEQSIIENDVTQATWLLRGAMDWTRQLLLQDSRHSALTTKHGLWAQRIDRMPIEDERSTAYFSGFLSDEQAKFNLLRLQRQGETRPEEITRLEKLLHSVQLPKTLATALAQQIAQAYQSTQHPATQVGGRLPSELIAAQSLSPAQRARLDDYTTLLPPDTLLNINMASPQVLHSYIDDLSLADAVRLTTQRDQGRWFNQASDLSLQLPPGVSIPARTLGVKSQWFSAQGLLEISGTQQSLQALVERKGSQAFIRWIRY